MLKKIRLQLLKWRTWALAKSSQWLIQQVMRSCKVEVEGLKNFCHFAHREKCFLMLWHNRLAIMPYFLSRYTPEIIYAALVSASRDGNVLSQIIKSLKNGRTISVSHQARYQALREIIKQINAQKQVVIITPDGPRGPLYEFKPGAAIAALETKAYVFSIDWEAKTYWELKTWDKLRLPKPFSTIKVKFSQPIRLSPSLSLAEAKELLKNHLNAHH